MAGRFLRLMMGRYYRSAYLPVELEDLPPAPAPGRQHVDGVVWRCVDLPLCQSVALQMIAGVEEPRRYFDFLMGFTYGAMYSRTTGFLPAGVDPEIGLVTAAPHLGLDRQYFVTNDAARYAAGLQDWLSQGVPVRVPLDMGVLYGSDQRLPHNEVLVGYDGTDFEYYEPVGLPPAACEPGDRPAGARGLKVSEDRLLQAVAAESEQFGYPWRYPFVVFLPGSRRTDLSGVWQQNSKALIGGKIWGRVLGAAAIEKLADDLERAAVDAERLEGMLRVGEVTRLDNALFLRETFPEQAALQSAAALFDRSGEGFRAARESLAGGREESAAALRDAADAERAAGEIFLRAAGLRT